MTISDFDHLLPVIGDFHRYQWFLFALLCFPFCFFVAFAYFGQIFISLEPDHWCHVPALAEAGLSLEERRLWSAPRDSRDGHSILSQCHMFDVDYEALVNNGTLYSMDTPVIDVNPWNATEIPCIHGWDYDLSEMYLTVVSDWNWVCDDNWKAPFCQSVFFLGCVVGCFFFGLISDTFGRIPSLVFTNLLAALAGIATAFSSGLITFAIFRFAAGLAFDTCFMVYYILVLEYVGPSKRTLVSNVALGVFYCFSTSVVPWIAYGIGNWRTFTIATSAPMATVLILWRILPESVRWLLAKGKIEEAVKIVKKFASVNRKEIEPNQLREFTISMKAEFEACGTKKYTLLDLLRPPRLRKHAILLFLLWFLIALVYDGHARNTHNLGFSVFYAFTIASSTELPAAVVVLLLLDRIGRRWMAALSLVLGGIVSLSFAVVPPGFPWLGAILAMTGRLFINISFNIGLQFAAEILPTSVRGQGMATAHLLGFVANIISPFVVYLAHFSLSLPLIIFGLISIFAGIIPLFLPETLGQNLPQTLEDGDTFGENQPFCFFPCFGKSPDVCSTTPAANRTTKRQTRLNGETRL